MTTCSGIQLGGAFVRQDGAGRFSLNDLHRASGGKKCNGPSNFLRLKGTMGLVQELIHEMPPVATVEGRAGGTYVCRELVYAYAVWISPAFFLQVIRTFDAAVGTIPRHLAPAPRPTTPDVYVYFLRQGPTADAPVKIGKTTDVSSRFKALQTASPYQLCLVATAPETNEVNEAMLHERFAHLRLEGEWFRPAPELLEFIAGIAPR